MGHYDEQTRNVQGQVQYTVAKVHISQIKVGDTIEHNGIFQTVGRNNIKLGFCGASIFGDSYHLGRKPVRLAKIFHARAIASEAT